MFEKIIDYVNKKKCYALDHNPPNMIVLQPGQYKWTCPKCHNVQIISVPLKGTL